MNEDALQWHRELVQGLCRSQAWPGQVGDFERIETHISTLVLAGDFALKLKKPVSLGFLDFSSLAQRRHFCAEELRINRRTAPQIYLEVLPVTGTLAAPRLGGPGEPLDWALLMRRFDNALLLDRLARAGALTAAHVDALARRVADLHAQAAPAPDGLGGADSALRWARDNLVALAAHPAAQGERARVAALRDWTEQRFVRLAPLMRERHAGGLVRECHGDLHLGNIVLLEGEPVPFDAVEFNAELRHIDVISDIAFAFMDLLLHRLPQLAWRLLGAYLEHTGDYAGVPLLRWFAVYRALVRAKVALLQGDAAPAEFERRLALAEQLTRPDPPLLVFVSGLSSSGKSTVAQRLAQALGGVRIRSDVERKRLHGLRATERSTEPTVLYGPEATRRTYARLGDCARQVLDGDASAVVDAAFLRRHERLALHRLAAALGVSCVNVECVAPDAVMRERLQHRANAGTDASDAGSEVLDLQLRVREALDANERATAVTLDTDRPLPDLMRHCDWLARTLRAGMPAPSA